MKYSILGCFRNWSTILCLCVVIAGGCQGQKSNVIESSPVNSEKVSAIVKILREMPDWSKFSFGQRHNTERTAIEKAVWQIAQYDTDSIRAAIAGFLRESRGNDDVGFSADAKIYVVNKFLFALPPCIRGDSPHFRVFGGGWLGLPVSGNAQNSKASVKMAIRWPWTEGEDGIWYLTGSAGGFMGPPYDALKAFDYYRRRFGRRKIDNNQ